MLNTLTVKTRLLLLIGVMAALTLAITVGSVVGLHTANGVIEAGYKNKMVPIDELEKIRNLLLKNRLAFVNSAVFPEESGKNIEQVKSNIAAITRLIEQYKASEQTPEERQLSDQFIQDRNRFVEQGLTVAIELVNAKDDKQLIHHIKENVRPLFAPVSDGIDALIQLKMADAQHEYQVMQRRFQRLAVTAIVVVIMGLSFSLFIGLRIIRSFIASVTTAQTVSLAIAKGDLNTVIDVGSNDELGVLLRSMQTMQDMLRQLVEEINAIANDAGRGDFSKRIVLTNKHGVSLDISKALNQFSDIVDSGMNDIIDVTGSMARGDLSRTVTTPYPGLFGKTKDALNQVAFIAKDVMNEFEVLMQDFESGNSTQRAQENQYVGDWRFILSSVNRILDNVSLRAENLRVESWVKTGLSALALQMRGDMAINTLAYQVIVNLAHYTQAHIGALYVWDEENQCLRLSGSYAYPANNTPAPVFKLGESLVGQAGLEQKILSITALPDEYVRITSATASLTIGHIMVVPIIHESHLKGVLELGSIRPFTPETLTLLELASQAIGMALAVAQSTVQTRQLLDQTQAQALRLQAQQHELQQSNEELEEQTQALLVSEQRLKQQQEELQQSNEELEEQTQALLVSEQRLQVQTEELQHTNTVLKERSQALEQQRSEVEQKNTALEVAQNDLSRKADELAMASQYKSEFLANMSHELRTPLNAMLLLSRSLSDNRDGNLTPKQVEAAQVMHQSGNDLLAIINDILDLSKIEAGHERAILESVSILELSSYLEALFRPVAEDKALAFEVTIADTVPAYLQTDYQRLGQILRNLLSNAFKFTQHGSVNLHIGAPTSEIKFATALSHETSVAFTVSDTGIGIASDKQHAIWEAFQQSDGSISRQYGGTGLGLAISRQLAQLLGGEIQLHSLENQGSTFSLYLPINGVNPLADTASAQSALPSHYPTISASELSPPTVKQEKPAVVAIADDRHSLAAGEAVILIVEDDPAFAKILAAMCHDNQYKYLATATAEEALTLLSDYTVVGVLLDMKLPEKDGWSVLTHVKESLEKAHIPVYVFSAESDYSHATAHGAIGFLTKPISAQQLQTAIDSVASMADEDAIRRILVIEDDPHLALSIGMLLGSEKTHLVTANKGAIAAQYLDQDRFDLIVLDLGLPDMSGLEWLELMHNRTRTTALPPVIIYTGRDLSREEYHAVHHYTHSIIYKSVQSDERLLEEARLFLHRTLDNLPDPSKKMLLSLHDKYALFQDKTVLLVDDDIRNLFSLSAVLEERGLSVISASTGEEALAKLASLPGALDLLITDIMMPKMDGFELIRQVRAQERFFTLPIIALTAKAMKDDRDRCLAAGASDYLTKPLDVDRLVAMMRVWLYR